MSLLLMWYKPIKDIQNQLNFFLLFYLWYNLRKLDAFWPKSGIAFNSTCWIGNFRKHGLLQNLEAWNTFMDFHFALKIQLKPQINCKIRSQKILWESSKCVKKACPVWNLLRKKNQLSIISTYITGSFQYILHISTSNSIYFEICQLCIFIYVPTYLLFWVVWNLPIIYFDLIVYFEL